jgi:hypothetical protein
MIPLGSGTAISEEDMAGDQTHSMTRDPGAAPTGEATEPGQLLSWALAIFRRATGAAQGYGEAAVNGYQQLVIALGEEEQR